METMLYSVALGPKKSAVFPGRWMLATFLREVGITGENFKDLSDIFDRILLVSAGTPQGPARGLSFIGSALRVRRRAATTLTHVQTVMEDEASSEEGTKMFRVFVAEEADGSRSLGYWCLAAGFTMGRIAKSGVRSIILMSGTLAPLDTWPLETGLEFQVQHEGEHVVDPSHVSRPP